MTTHIQNAVNELATTLARKNSDYAPTDEFSNFRLAAHLAGLKPWDAMLIQIGIKYSRLMNLVSEGVGHSEYEGVRDTLMDLAGYAVIAAGYQDSQNVDQDVKLPSFGDARPWIDARPSWIGPELSEDE